MIQFKTAAIGVAIFALTGGAAFAQGGTMIKGDAMAKPMKMSRADTKMMKSCHAMSHDMMMKNKGCMKMMKMHPDMMKSDGMMKNDGMMKK